MKVNVTRKKMKNLRLIVDRESGDVKVSVPHYTANNEIDMFVISHLDWIQQRKNEILNNLSPIYSQVISGGKTMLWGREYTIEILLCKANYVNVDESIKIFSKTPSDLTKCEKILMDFYRNELKASVPDLLLKYQAIMDTCATQWSIRKMKSRWGSCNTIKKSIILNTELAKMHPGCLEYVIVHELAHTIESGHTARFWQIVERAFPDWKHYHAALKSL